MNPGNLVDAARRAVPMAVFALCYASAIAVVIFT